MQKLERLKGNRGNKGNRMKEDSKELRENKIVSCDNKVIAPPHFPATDSVPTSIFNLSNWIFQ